MTGYVYFVQVGNGGPIKIGYAGNVKSRMQSLQSGNHRELRLVGAIRGDIDLERRLHSRCCRSHLRGEWYTPTDEFKAQMRQLLAEPSADWKQRLFGLAADADQDAIWNEAMAS